jgi:thiamine pyrophosphate-dependent acetolactate synthase large subunit-like protein
MTNQAKPTVAGMPLVDALAVIAELRTDQIVITTMGSAREWPKRWNHPLDFHYVPSAMGQAPSLGLGLAMALPDREVIVFNGDGSMLMNLGSLVTIGSSGVSNLTIILLDNGVYEVTGGQRTAAAAGPFSFSELARSAGFPTVGRFELLDRWRSDAPALLRSPGPRFVQLAVEPVRTDFHVTSPGPFMERISAFREALRTV